MAKLDQPRLANATPEYTPAQLDQIIRTIEQMVVQLNSTFTQDATHTYTVSGGFRIYTFLANGSITF